MSGEHETRREFSAVPIALVVSAFVGAVFVGVWLGVLTAIVVVVGLALLAVAGLFVWFTRRPRLRASDAPRARTIDDSRYRILVVANESYETSALIDELLQRAAGRPASVFVTAPALESRLDFLAGDQKSYDEAARRLAVTIEALKGAGIEARGKVGSNDPLQSTDDALRQFPADEILLVTHDTADANWLEKGVAAAAESRYDQPVKRISIANP